MPLIIKSSAFPGGYASYTSVDPDEEWISNHENLSAWVSGQGVSVAGVDNIWDDLVNPGLSYAPSGTGDVSPGVGPDGRPAIRCDGGGIRNEGLVIPPSYTMIATASYDAITGVSQTIIGSNTGSYPNCRLFISATGVLAHGHNASGAYHYYDEVIPTDTTVLVGADFSASTFISRLYYNDFAPKNTKIFDTAPPADPGVAIGQLGTGGVALTGYVSDALIFDAVLSEADRARVMRYLARRSGIAVTGV